MAERKFTRGLSKPGSAAQVRETVSQVVRQSTVLAKPPLVEPIDYETFIAKNKTILHNDPQRELLLYPPDDVSQSTTPRRYRTVVPVDPARNGQQISNRCVLQSIKTYTSCWDMIHYKYNAYSSSNLQLSRLSRPDNLEEQVYEVDAVTNPKEDEVDFKGVEVTKQGFLLKGPESRNDTFITSMATKSFKRRYVYLKREVDGTYVLEFHKDDRKKDPKFTICMEFCNEVVQNVKRGKFSFELRMQEGHKSYALAAESEAELEDWLAKLMQVVHNSKLEENNSKVIISDFKESPCTTPDRLGTLKGLEHSRNPELIKFAKETDHSIAASRKDNRHNVFAVYPELTKIPETVMEVDELEAEPYREQFGTRIIVRCESVKFELQVPSETDRRQLCQIEPYTTTMSLYNAKTGKKISEDFRFDVNHPTTRNAFAGLRQEADTARQTNGCADAPSTNGPGNGNAKRNLSSCPANLDGLSDEWLAYPNQAIFNVSHPDPEIYLVIRIEKILQGSISQAIEPYMKASRNADIRASMKVQRTVKSCCQRLGMYNMPFAWAAKPVFKPYSGQLDACLESIFIFKEEASRLSEEDLLKSLSEWRKSDKKHKLTQMPGSVMVSIEPFEKLVPNCLTSSMVPIRPFPLPPTHAVTMEIDEFSNEVPKDSFPFTAYLNHLYVYPKCLKYETQKTFVKARNIACVVEFRESDGADARSLPCIYGRPGEGIYNSKAICAVVHHSTVPDFFEEVKIELPAQLHEKHHILFTFLHVSCELSKGAKKKDQLVETPVGFAWFPILQDGRLNVEGQSVPVAANLPPGYLSCRNLGLGKGYSGPDIRWVEAQKPLFNFDLRLNSTVYAKDKHLHNFFAHVQKLAETKSGCSDAETCKNIKAMHAIDVSALVNFLPTILNELFHLLVSTLSEEVSLNVIKVIIHIIHTIHDVGKTEILHSYVKFVFNTDSLDGNAKTTLHEELTKCLITTLRPANTDFLVINKFLKHSWFFFHTLIKSMAQHLLTTGKIKLYRHERFSSDYHFRIQGLLQGLMHHIVNKYKELPDETRQANRSLSYFMKKCLTFMDRGFVFKLINFYVDKFNLGDPKVLQEYKFEFLQIVMSHEHYISLNLPLLRGGVRRGQQRNMKEEADFDKDLEHEYHLSTEFCRNHFLVGILLQEVRVALNEVRDVRRIAVGVLRNLLAKHAFDDRYQNKAQQARIASLYLPVISVILENLNRLNCAESAFAGFAGGDCGGSLSTLNSSVASSLASSSNPLAVIATPMTTPRLMSHRYTIGPDALRSSLLGEKHRRSSSFLTMISGQSGNSGQEVSTPEASLSSLNSSSSTLSASSQQELCGESLIMHESRTRVDGVPSHSRSHSVPLNVVRHDKLVSTEVKDLLICFLYVLKNISEELLIGWWQHCSEHDILDFFQVLEICLHHFKYVGLKQITNVGRIPMQNGVAPKSMTLPARMGPPSFSNSNGRTMSSCSETVSIDNIVDADCLYRALLEANMTTEVGLIVLDVLGLYLVHFKEQLLQNDGDNTQMKKVSGIYLAFLQIGQSEKLLKHLFASLRAFVNKFPAVLFLGSATLCGKFCYEILKCCNSNLSTTRNEACAILYLMMRSNYEFTGRRGLTRVHLQVIISVSQLLGDVIGSNCNRFQESLSSINNYANSDKAMQMTSFPSEVKDLTKRIRTVLMATMQMREHENDPEMLIDLQHSLANSYSSTPELRKTWLESMSKIHKKNGDHSEAAFCYIHIAALVAEYLKQKGVYPGGCEAFASISSNIVHDESFIKEDSGMQDTHYTEETLLEMLKKSAELLETAERYELICDIFKISLPLHERQRDFESQAACYKCLYNACSKVIEVNRSGRRLLGKYYRVAFFGQAFFEDDAGKEYVYKEPKVTSLPEISERLYMLFCDKFGKDAVKMIMDSVNVEPKDLDPKFAFIQVTHVTPHFEESEADSRVTDFERNNNLRQFVFETPFTLSGKARGEPDEQYKRKTILKTIHAFPYIKKRIAIFSKRVIELTPIEVAIEEMENRVAELVDVINLEPPDFKKLQLKLQGSISVQVNAGPIAYANAFLDAKNNSKYSKEKVQDLKELFKNFLSVCAKALELNGKLITSDQHEYHDAMKNNFQELACALSDMFNEKLLGEEKSSPGRNSLIFFNYISATPGSSTA